MSKYVVFVTWLCLFIVIAASLWVWQGLPNLDRYPIHWNAQGAADGYGSKNYVFFNLLTTPIIMGAVFFINFIANRLEKRKANQVLNERIQGIIWVVVMVFMVGIHFILLQSYVFLGEKPPINLLSFMTISFSVLFIFIGNLLGKIRQNSVLGIRTPWTLKSEQTWDRTHRILGHIFVAFGLVSFCSIFFLSPLYSFLFMNGLTLLVVLCSLIISYGFWKTSSDKEI